MRMWPRASTCSPLNCAPCHTITGAGDALSGGIQAPPLHGAARRWSGRRSGPAPATCRASDPGRCHASRRTTSSPTCRATSSIPIAPADLGLGGVGPVAEGFVGLFVGVGACLLAAFWVGDRTDTDERRRSRWPRWPRRSTMEFRGRREARRYGRPRARPCLTAPGHAPNRRGPRLSPPVTIPVRSVVKVDLEAPQFQVAAKNPRRVEMLAALGFLLGRRLRRLRRRLLAELLELLARAVTLGVGFAGVGDGMVAWGKYLMPRGPSRRTGTCLPRPTEERQAFIERLRDPRARSQSSAGLPRQDPRPRGRGSSASCSPSRSCARSGRFREEPLHDRLAQGLATSSTSPDARVKVNDIEMGGFITVFPPDDIGGAYSQTMLIHVHPPASGYLPPPPRYASRHVGPHGYIAFSKVCTHAGCPVGLYEQLTGSCSVRATSRCSS